MTSMGPAQRGALHRPPYWAYRASRWRGVQPGLLRPMSRTADGVASGGGSWAMAAASSRVSWVVAFLLVAVMSGGAALVISRMISASHASLRAASAVSGLPGPRVAPGDIGCPRSVDSGTVTITR